MPKQFYTEKDIEDLFRSGKKSLPVTGDIVLTELALEKARQLGVQLVMDHAEYPPGAPVRPYLSDVNVRQVKPNVSSQTARASTAPDGHSRNVLPIEQRIRSAVVAKLGNQVDAALLDNIIHRVVKGLGIK